MTFPTYQAQGTFVGSATANISPAWPAHQAGDIGILVVESMEYNPINLITAAGFKEIPSSPRGSAVAASSGSNSSTQIRVFWKRATSGAEGAPTIKFEADHIYGGIFTIRGCAAAGCPFTICTGDHSDGTSDATIDVPGFATTTADQLVVVIGATGINNTTSNRFTGLTNASLATITERFEALSAVGGGSQIGVYTGQKAAAGSVNASSIAIPTGAPNSGIAIAFTAVEQGDDDTPWLANMGPMAETTAATLTPVWPEHIAGDIALLLVESDAWPVTLSVAAGFVEVPNSPQTAGSSGTATAAALTMFWCRATSGAMTNPTINKPGDHIGARIITFRGCVATGDPWDVGSGSNNNGASSTSVSIPGATTTVPETLVFGGVAQSLDAGGAHFSAWTNANLDNPIERFDEGHTFSFGGGIGAFAGRKITAGAFGSTTATLDTASHQGRILLALKAATTALRQLLADLATMAISGKAAALTWARVLLAAFGVGTITGKPVTFSVTVSYAINTDMTLLSLIASPVTIQKLYGHWRKTGPTAVDNWRLQGPPT